MGTKRIILWLTGALITIVVFALVYDSWSGLNFLQTALWDQKGQPFCHKQIELAFRVWMGDRKTDVFPNVAGVGRDSLAQIHEEINRMDWAKSYRYVPGLNLQDREDRGDLILMYFDQPTRFTWHGARPTVFMKKGWIIVPVDFKFFGSRRHVALGEMSEHVTTDEFKRRLKETIEFVRTNARPHWQTVVAEHTKFLESIEHAP